MMRLILKSRRSWFTSAFLGICLASVCLRFSGTACLAQNIEDSLLNRRVSLRVKEGTIEEALNRLAGEESIPIGWEIGINNTLRHDVNIDLKKATLKEVLDYLVLSEPSYQWRVQDGVINFVPAHNRDETLEKLLSLRIKTFEPPKGLDVIAFRDALLELPEVHEFLQSNGLEASHTVHIGVHIGGAIPPPLNLELRTVDTELRGILNKVICNSDRRLWIVSRSGESRQLLHLAL